MKACNICKKHILKVCKPDETCRYFEVTGTPPRGYRARSKYLDEVFCENSDKKTGKKFFGKFYKKSLTDNAKNEIKVMKYLEEKGYNNNYYPSLLSFDEKAKIINYKSKNATCENNTFDEENTPDCIDEYIGLVFENLDDFKNLEELKKDKELSSKEKHRVYDKVLKRFRKLHQLGVSHGDSFEQNIMYKKHKNGIGVRLIDFSESEIDASKDEIDKEKKKINKKFSRDRKKL